MRAIDYFRGVTDTFRHNRVRSALTLLGIMIGSGSIVMLAGLLRGAEESLLRMNQSISQSDTLRIDKDEAPPKQFEKAQRELSRSDAEALTDSRRLGDVNVAIETRRESRAYYKDRQKRVRLVGGNPRSMQLYRLAIAKGRFVGAEDLIRGERVVVIGHEIWKELLEENPDPIGIQLKIDDMSYTIIGVLEHKPSMGHGDGTWLWDRKALIPQTAFDAVLEPSHRLSSIFLRSRGAKPGEKWMSMMGAAAERIILRRHFGVKNFKLGDRNEGNQERLIISIIEILLLGTGLMSLFVGGINIMNIMLVTVTERTREIGIRRAVGASPGAISIQFLLEAGVISSLGGLLGVIGGIAMLGLVVFGLKQAFGEWPFHLEPWSIVLGLALALVTGLVFGLFPAWRASRLDPVEALRYE